jgi:hypothetical protein
LKGLGLALRSATHASMASSSSSTRVLAFAGPLAVVRVFDALDFDSGDRTAEADPAGRIAAVTATAAASAAGSGAGEFLTCDQLFRGYVNLSEWARGVAGQLEASQQWMRERLLDPPPTR